MESDSKLFTKYFFPSYFKIIGLILVTISILALLFAALIRSYLDFFPAAGQILITVRLSLVCGLSLIIFSKEKSESEETDKSRFNALLFSVAASVFIFIILEVINIFYYQVLLSAVDFFIIEMCLYYIFFRLQL